MIYKVWAEIEEIDHELGYYESLQESAVDLAEFDTMEEAEAYIERLSVVRSGDIIYNWHIGEVGNTRAAWPKKPEPPPSEGYDHFI